MEKKKTLWRHSPPSTYAGAKPANKIMISYHNRRLSFKPTFEVGAQMDNKQNTIIYAFVLP